MGEYFLTLALIWPIFRETQYIILCCCLLLFAYILKHAFNRYIIIYIIATQKYTGSLAVKQQVNMHRVVCRVIKHDPKIGSQRSGSGSV